MSLTATVNITAVPPTLTVVSDRREVKGTVTVGGETASYTARFPIAVVDDSGRSWTPKSDDGVTAVFEGLG